MIDPQYQGATGKYSLSREPNDIFNIVSENRKNVDERIQRICDLTQNKELIPAIYELKSLMKTKVLFYDQVEKIQHLSFRIKKMVRQKEKNWEQKICNQSDKEQAYREMLGYCQFLAEEQLSPDSSFKAFSKSVDKNGSLAELEKVCGKRSLEVLTKILQANCQMQAGDHYVSMMKLSEIQKSFPSLFLLNLTIGKLYLATGQSERALDVFNKMFDEYPDADEVYIGLSKAHEAAGHTLLAYDWACKANLPFPLSGE